MCLNKERKVHGVMDKGQDTKKQTDKQKTTYQNKMLIVEW